jgi:hypothetical protein
MSKKKKARKLTTSRPSENRKLKPTSPMSAEEFMEPGEQRADATWVRVMQERYPELVSTEKR